MLTLLHERSHCEPEAVEKGELILPYVVFTLARMRLNPLVRREASQHEYHHTDDGVDGEHVKPDVIGQRTEKGEEFWRGSGGLEEEEGNSRLHELTCKVDHVSPLVRYRQVSYGQIGFLQYALFIVSKCVCQQQPIKIDEHTSNSQSDLRLWFTYPVNKLAHHAIPCA